MLILPFQNSQIWSNLESYFSENVNPETKQPTGMFMGDVCDFGPSNYIVKLLVEFPATEKHKNWQSVESYSSVYGGKITHDPITMVFYCYFLVMSYTELYPYIFCGASSHPS